MEKNKEEKVKRFYAGVVKLAHTEHVRLTEEQVTAMWRRILNSFAVHPDGSGLADGFVAVINYFAGIGYWRGYKNARKHYAALNTARRTPDGRQEVHREIAKMLEDDIEMPADEICDQLDKMGLSASFDLKIRESKRLFMSDPNVSSAGNT